jgi:hypothetical protein
LGDARRGAKVRTVLLISAGVLALAGCDKLTNGQTPPARRDGLWLQTFVHDGVSRGPSALGPVRVCVDASSEAKNPIFNFQAALKRAQAHNCGVPVATRSLNGVYRFSTSCPLPGGNGVSNLKGDASGNFTTAFHLRLETDLKNPPPFDKVNSHHVTEVDGSWLGPCPPDMAPGDMLLANGVKAPGGRLANPHERKLTPPNAGKPPTP